MERKRGERDSNKMNYPQQDKLSSILQLKLIYKKNVKN